jgi:hypothetical protein
MIKWVRGLSEKLGFMVVTTKSDNGGNGRKLKDTFLLDVKEADNIGSMQRRKGRRRLLLRVVVRSK